MRDDPAPISGEYVLTLLAGRRTEVVTDRFFPGCENRRHLHHASVFASLELTDPDSGLPFPFQLDVNDGFHRQVREPAYILSLLSIVQASTEISAHYPHDVTLAAELIKAWKEISTDVLLGRAMWALRTKELLRVLG